MEKKIQSIFENLIQLQSDTGTVQERKIAKEIKGHLSKIPYFKENPEHLIFQNIPSDPFGRCNIIGLVKGKSDITTVLIHHHDAVDIEVYEDLKSLAFKPEQLKEALKEKSLAEEISIDLNSSEWIFGRGTADMKAGAAIQIALIDYFSSDESFDNNLVILSVCDEENLSAGMRAAATALSELKDKYRLDYRAIINSEPVGRSDENNGIYYEGTVGKIMPILYSRGKKAHIGEIYSGLNPLFLLSEIQSEIELNPALTDEYKGEVTPSPTWVYYRDRKAMYDASIPESAAAYFSILTLERTPKTIMEDIKTLSENAFNRAVKKYENCVEAVNQKSCKDVEKLKFNTRVMTVDELNAKLMEEKGELFKNAMEKETEIMKQKLDVGKINLQNASIQLIEKAVTFLDDIDPIVVIGLSGPYYPHLTNEKLGIKYTKEFEKMLNDITKENFNMSYDKRHYFMGISDFSYTSLILNEDDVNTIENNMLGWGKLYDIPFKSLEQLNIPMINIGPWGKDLHKLTERVNKDDLFRKVPLIIKEFVRAL